MRFIQILCAAAAAAALLAAGPALASPKPTDLWVLSGNDTYVVAIDLASLQREGDTVSVTQVTYYQVMAANGADYRVARERIDCRADTLQTLEWSNHLMSGEEVAHSPAGFVGYVTPATNAERRQVAFACQGNREGQQKEGVTIGQVAMTVRAFWPTGEVRPDFSADYYLYGFNDSIAKGMDVATLRRRGSVATYKSVAVFRAPDANGFDYVISEEEIDCAAHTSHLVAAEGYRMGRIPVGPYPFADDGPGPIPPASMGELEYTFACTGARTPSVHVGPHDANAIAVYVRGDWPVH